VLLNAGAALLVAGRAATVRDGIAMAEGAIDSGRARGVLAQMAALAGGAS
jgi:anthranilate phosphoribosyltransferase